MPLSSHGLSNPADLLTLLAEARITASDTIRVTGPSGLSALLWLCRHGFAQVGYLRPGHGPHEAADALIVAHTCDELALRRLLVDGPHVRDGGVLILQSPASAMDGAADPIHRLLVAHGYRVERRLRGARRELRIARRMAQPARTAA
jgi:hypothetical protein